MTVLCYLDVHQLHICGLRVMGENCWGGVDASDRTWAGVVFVILVTVGTDRGGAGWDVVFVSLSSS